jgi:signal peptide peptidase SppA
MSLIRQVKLGIRKTLRKVKTTLSGAEKSYIPLIRLEGVIGGKGYGKKGLCLDAIKSGLNDAFAFDDTSDIVAIIINSPGGSPSQSSLIYKYLCHLKAKKNKKILAFIEDVAASGGYYIACAADEIYADNHSITGSIGVVSGGFGFTKALEKLGIERRVHTSGENKSMLDPFSPEKPDDIEHLKSIQKDIHAIFKQVVTDSRGDKLHNPQENELFTGKFWVAERAKTLGLIDDIQTIEQVMFARYGKKYKIVPMTLDKRSFFEKRFGMFASDIADNLTDNIELMTKTSLWNRFLG